MPLFGLSDVLRDYISQTNTVNNFPLNSSEALVLGTVDPTELNDVTTQQGVAYFGYSIWGLAKITDQDKPPLN